MKTLIALLLLTSAGAASAQMVDGSQLFPEARREKKAKDEPAAVAQAVELAFGATTWAQVLVSTAGPVIELSRLVREGFYKRELITLTLIAAKSKTPLFELVAARRKKAALSELSFSRGLDYDAIYESALAVEAIVDKQYLKRFPQRGPGRPRDGPE
jgi:hypothetical protein